MKTKWWAVLLMVICTAFTSISQILWKIGADKLKPDIISIITNHHILTGLFLYAIASVIMIIAFRHGELTILYPILATSYIWVILLSIPILGETASLPGWIGVIFITLGVITINT